jgi:Abnormal spindle-like microcephaly-assoc'd, ASPM-SPD-2-Hydin
VTISSVTPSVASVAISGITLPAKLAPGSSATVTAAYKPTSAGSAAGKLTVTSNAVGSPTIVDLSGTAAAASIQLTPSATSLSFGNVTVGSSGTNKLTVKSTGNTNASISKVAVTGTGFVLGSSVAAVILDPAQSETYTVNFDPKATGNVSGALTITSNAANSPMNISLTGSGAAAAAQHTVALTWERSSSTVTGYFVYRSSKPSGPYTQLNSTPEANPSFSDGSVSNGQVYYYYVTAVNSSNIQSTDSNQVSVTIPSN